ncbi:MAG: Tad domain-containing protein [Planctomycetes bacterium]|nr:Tad domain-containing protein [Planctomycetota bacterium]
MVITMLATLLLAAIVFWVINTGRQVDARVVTQNAADSTATAGAGWVARAFNTVAMNNVAISRYLAVINTLDSVPLVTEAALHEQTFLRDALSQRYQGLSTGSAALNQNATTQFKLLLDELTEEVQTLDGVNKYYAGYDVTRMTHYAGPHGKGELWRAMQSLDQMSQATMENVIPLAQTQANNAGAANLPSGGAALLVPASDEPLWLRGRFADFERPVRQGLLPLLIDDTVTNRGPYDTIFGWRGTARVADPNDPGEAGSSIISGVNTGGAARPFGGGPGDLSRGGRAPRTIPRSYYTYGTQTWTLDNDVRYFANRGARPNLNKSRYSHWITLVSNAKLEYLWSGMATRYFAKPVWDPAQPEDLPAEPREPLPFSETAFFRLDVKSRLPLSNGGFMRTAGTWAYPYQSSDSRAVIVRQPGWWLPNTNGQDAKPPHPMAYPDELSQLGIQITRAAASAWVYEFKYTVFQDPEIGIALQLDSEGRPVPQTAYFVQVVVYGGVNRNLDYPGLLYAPNGDDDPEIVNPYKGFNPSAADAPSPIDLNHSILKPDADSRRQHLSFFAVTTQADTALVWPALFDSKRPYPKQTAIAQARVSNNHSFDLWTQMWQAQLEPIDRYEDWLSQMQAGVQSGYPNVSAEEADGAFQFLTSLTPLAPVILSH